MLDCITQRRLYLLSCCQNCHYCNSDYTCGLYSTMGKPDFSCLVTITVSFSVYGSCVACSQGFNENVEGILGRNINLTCNSNSRCNNIGWDKITTSGTILLSEESVQVSSSKSYLPLSGIRFDYDGRYRCYCDGSDGYVICSVSLRTVCQATVILHGRMIVYNNSLPNSHIVDVTAGERITITCSEGATLKRNCTINLLPAPHGPTYKFEVSQEHNLCSIECRLRSEGGGKCSVNFILDVLRIETSTQPSTTSSRGSTVSLQPSLNENVLTTTSSSNISPVPTAVVTASDIPNERAISSPAYTTMPVLQQAEKDNTIPDKSGPFPVMLLIGISIAVFVVILSIICFFIYFSRSKSSSRPKKTQRPGNVSSDTNIPIGPTYATVNKSTPGCTKGDVDDSERGIPCADDAYAEVDSSGKGESTQQVNAVTAETAITKDYYSVVNTSNAKQEPMDSANKSDSALYTEVNKEDKQAGKKVGTYSPGNSDCNPNVPDDQSYDVLEQPESSDYDDVSAASASPALYAVVDRERKEE